MPNYSFEVSLPLDKERFLRRECPYCKMQFKVYKPEDKKEEVEEDERADKEVHCPYCGQSAGRDEWYTTEQIQHIKDVTSQKFVRPILNNFAKQLKGLGNGLLKINVSTPQKVNPKTLTEVNDMRKVELECCKIPIKIEQDWEKEIYCIACGKANQTKE